MSLSRGKVNQANEILFTFPRLLQLLCDTCLKGSPRWDKAFGDIEFLGGRIGVVKASIGQS